MTIRDSAVRTRLQGWALALGQVWGRITDRKFASSWAIALTLYTAFALYRALLWWRFLDSETPPFGFVLSRFPLQNVIAAHGWDAVVAALLALPFFLVLRKSESAQRSWLYWACGASLCTVAAFLCVVHLRMMFDRGEQLGFAVLTEALGGAMTLAEAWSYGDKWDHAVALSPLLLLPFCSWISVALSPRSWQWLLRLVGFVVLCTGLCAFLAMQRRFHNRIHHNPLQYGFADLAASLWHGEPRQRQMAQAVSAKQSRSLQLIDNAYVAPHLREVPALSPRLVDAPPWNVLLVVMESTGSQYIFRDAGDGQVAMPVLKALSQEGLWAEQHYSTANSSHRSLFSLFTGLYPEFSPAYSCLRPDITIPTVFSFLPPAYDTFMMTPGDLRSYFPRALLRRSGLSDIQGGPELGLKSPRPSGEIETREFDFLGPFKRRLARAKRPYFGVYYSYVPHFHYPDYGPEFRPTGDLLLAQNRYINNLRVLDRVIEMLVSELKATGDWDNTVLVLVGDHGEAFGEHQFYTHGNDSHNVALQTPLFLRFPGISPSVTRDPTSHVDLLPTLLDILGLKYEPRLLQGESLLQSEHQNRYVFTVGNEQAFTSVDMQGHKVLQKLRSDTCKAFDLGSDPSESRPLPCSTFREQHQSLANFAAYQTKVLDEYSASHRSDERDFYGLRHPTLRPFIK